MNYLEICLGEMADFGCKQYEVKQSRRELELNFKKPVAVAMLPIRFFLTESV